MDKFLPLGKFSFGMGDRFAHQGKAQLRACIMASERGVEVVPVWNKSNREHNFTGTEPLSLRAEADAAVKALGWEKPYHGYLKNRVAIPLRDNDGALIGYAGRVVDDTAITEDNSRYRFPGARERDGKIFEFRKTLFLYNGFRFKAPLDNLIVVESFTSVWWLFQNDLPNVIGTMGADCSEKQAELIVSLVKPKGHVWMLTDGDPAGERHASSHFSKVSLHRFVRWVKMADGNQPTDLSAGQLKACFPP